jgi:hypothetical protein
MGPDAGADHPVVDDADAVGVRDPDGAGQQPGLADPFETGHLAVAVQPVAAGVDRFGEDVAVVRHDHRHACPDWALPDDERALASHDRRVTDADARHVRDRVGRPRLSPTDDDAEIPRSGQLHPPSPWNDPSPRMGPAPIIAP